MPLADLRSCATNETSRPVPDPTQNGLQIKRAPKNSRVFVIRLSVSTSGEVSFHDYTIHGRASPHGSMKRYELAEARRVDCSEALKTARAAALANTTLPFALKPHSNCIGWVCAWMNRPTRRRVAMRWPPFMRQTVPYKCGWCPPMKVAWPRRKRLIY